MRILVIGGTGTISTAVVSRMLGLGWDVTVLNRGRRAEAPEGVRVWTADIDDGDRVRSLLAREHFDAVADFIVFTPQQAERDIRLFSGKTDQYVFISSASAYQKPVPALPITEDTPLINPYWQYSRNKAACEKLFLDAFRNRDFPVTIVRPSHTYGPGSLPLQIHGSRGPWQVLQRMRQGKTVPVAADGETLWTLTTSEDFAVYFCGLCGNKKAIGQAYHITGPESLTWNEIYRIVAAALGVGFNPCYIPASLAAKAPEYDLAGALLGDKINSVLFDNSKVQRDTGIPQIAFTSFREAGPECTRYFLHHPELQTEDPEFDAFCDRVEAAMREAEKIIRK